MSPIKAVSVSNRLSPVLGWGACALFYLYQYFLQTTPSMMPHQLMQYFQIDALGLGHLSAWYFYAYIVVQLYAGILIDAYGVRAVLGLSSLMCAIGAVIFSVSSLFFVAELGRVMMGAAGATAFVGTSRFIATQFSCQQVGFYIGATESLGYIGAIMAGTIGSVAAQVVGWKNTFYVTALIGLIVALVIFISLEKTAAPVVQLSKGSDETIVDLLSQRRVWFYAILASMLCAPIPALACLWGPYYIAHVFSFSGPTSASMNSFIFVGLIVGCPLVSALAKRYGQKAILQIGSGLSCLCLLMLIMAPSNCQMTWLCLIFFLLGLTNSVFVLTFYQVQRFTSSLKGTVISFINMMSLLGGVLLQPLIGYMIQKKISWISLSAASEDVYLRCVVVVVLLCLLLAFMMTCFIRKE